MREVLFRGRAVSTNELVYGYYARISGLRICDTFLICGNLLQGEGEYYDTDGMHVKFNKIPELTLVFPNTVSQFTGLYTIDGKRIFENDIVVEALSPMKRWVVKFEDGNFVLKRNGQTKMLSDMVKHINLTGTIMENIEDV